MKHRLVIMGNGGFASEVAAYILSEPGSVREIGRYEDNCKGISSAYFTMSSDIESDDRYIVGTGNPYTNEKLIDKAASRARSGFYFQHSSANVYSYIPDWNPTIVCPGVTITTRCSIGWGCVFNLNCTVGHDTKIGNFCVVNPGANISGKCNIGPLTLIGTGATIKEGITVGRECVIGAGAVVVKDIPDGETWVGNPAKKLVKYEEAHVKAHDE